MEGTRRWDEGVETGEITANFPSDKPSFHFFIQEEPEFHCVPFRKLFSLRVNDPPSTYIIRKGQKDFRRKNSTVVVNILPWGS